MSSKVKKIARKLPKGKFPVEMCNTLLGSFLVSLYILQKTSILERKDLIDIYKTEKKKWLKENIDEVNWMFDLVKVLNKKNEEKVIKKDIKDPIPVIEIPYGDIAFVQSNWNCLIAPYLDLGEGKQILPLRDDGFTGVTLTSGKIYPIEKKTDH